MSRMEQMAGCTRLFLAALASVDDEQLAAPLALPGWTGRHLVAHVHHNAEALGRLVTWAATGVEHRMYASPAQRAAEIERSAALPGAQLRSLVRQSAGQLADALLALAPAQWSARVVTAQGRTVAATEIPWLRTREMAVHAVDLNAGITFGDVPADVLLDLLGDVARPRRAGAQGPALAAWLTGRDPHPPSLGPWL